MIGLKIVPTAIFSLFLAAHAVLADTKRFSTRPNCEVTFDSSITGTQSMMGFYDNPAALVCLQNSDWSVFLAQKPEVIDQLVAEGKLTAPDGIAHSLKTLTKVNGQFTELAIRGPVGWDFGRLLLDQYSLGVFSTTGSTVQRLSELRETRGMNIGGALEMMVENGEVN
jgi:conjugal transfer ATP-binding protein TraC